VYGVNFDSRILDIGYKGNLQECGFALESYKLSNYKWKVCGGLKVIGLLQGMQSGCTKFCCFLCKWDSQTRDTHYKIKDWPM
jgi:hypothetical protein